VDVAPPVVLVEVPRLRPRRRVVAAADVELAVELAVELTVELAVDAVVSRAAATAQSLPRLAASPSDARC